MKFDLTEEIRNQIIFSMEDQEKTYVFDSIDLKLVSISEAEDCKDRFYSIPVWNSMSGFKLMGRFVSLLRNPLARESLRCVLFNGRGVFRNFKNVLKEYPEVERLWYTFKDREMNQIIIDWYNVLCESWGLEKLGQEPDENADVIHEDFNFREANLDQDADNIFMCSDDLMKEIENLYTGEPGIALAELWQSQRYSFDQESECTIVAETVDGDFAGCITTTFISEKTCHTGIITTIFVIPRYRGLGISAELLSQCLIVLKKKGIRWVLCSSHFIPKAVINILQNSGFKQLGTGFIVEL